MSVMQRKLFANKEARTKLRDMGGIMSSFPELSGEVQRFQAGGGVAPGSTAAPASAGAPTYNDFVAAARAGQPLGEQELIRSVEAGMLTPQQAADAQAMMDGYVPSEQEVRVATAPDPTPMTDTGYIPPAGYQAVENFILGVTGDTLAERQAREEEYAARAGEDYKQRVPSAAPAEAAPAPAEEEPGMTTGTPIYEQRIADLLPTPAETPDPTTDETGGGETDTPDIRARAEERIKLFQDLFGSDEPTARDRAMQFAMIGLAIAAGQSPNALTNIASGLLAGTQAMTAQEAERRKERRALRSSAVTSVLNEIEAERKAASGDGGFQDREALDDAVRVVATELGRTEDYQYETPEVRFGVAWDLLTRLPGYAPYRALPNPYTPAPPPGGTGAAVPTDAPSPAFPDDMTEDEKAAYGG
jgi:hypothetical protein